MMQNLKMNQSLVIAIFIFILILIFQTSYVFNASEIRNNDLNMVNQIDILSKNDNVTSNELTLFAPINSTITYLIKNSGEVIHTWNSNYKPKLSVCLIENGNLLRTARKTFNPIFSEGGGAGGYIEEIDWDSTVIWNFEYSSNQYCLHHDIEKLPNGNILMIAWEYKTASEAIAAGRDPNLLDEGMLWPDHIIEIEPTGTSGGNIVWEWHVWDHLIQDYDPLKENYGVVAEHPELIDINFAGNRDFNHINSVDYNDEFDQIILSVHSFSEIWIVDHSTTTLEAAGHTGGNSGKGGDILYRWGNPQAYRAGSSDDRKLFRQHDAQWIESGCPGDGNILIFNNGRGRPGEDYSSVDEIVPPVDSNGNYYLTPGFAYGPEEPIWMYIADNSTDFYAQQISGAQRLPNGNTLICDGPKGIFFEVTLEKEIVWEYVNPFPNPMHNNVFKAYRYYILFDQLITFLKDNWNFVSIPFNQSINLTDLIIKYDDEDYNWTEATSVPIVDPNVYGWDRSLGMYVPATTMEPGYGYWIYAYFDCELRVENLSATPDNYITDLELTWNAIGVPFNQPVNIVDLIVHYDGADYSWADATSMPIVDPNVYGWDRALHMYVPISDALEPGYAYWMYAYQKCNLRRS